MVYSYFFKLAALSLLRSGAIAAVIGGEAFHADQHLVERHHVTTTTSYSSSLSSRIPTISTSPTSSSSIVLPTSACQPSTLCAGASFSSASPAKSTPAGTICNQNTALNSRANIISETVQTEGTDAGACAAQCLKDCNCKSFALTTFKGNAVCKLLSSTLSECGSGPGGYYFLI